MAHSSAEASVRTLRFKAGCRDLGIEGCGKSHLLVFLGCLFCGLVLCESSGAANLIGDW